jgi:DNA-binding response OmpR family regulator
VPAAEKKMSALKKLLILEDDREMCEELSEVLKAEGYAVDMAFDGQSAKSIIEKDNHEVYLLDMKVPGIGGLQLLREIKDKSPQAKVVMISANPAVSRFLKDGVSDDEELKALKFADGVISKPFHIEELLETIHKLATP